MYQPRDRRRTRLTGRSGRTRRMAAGRVSETATPFRIGVLEDRGVYLRTIWPAGGPVTWADFGASSCFPGIRPLYDYQGAGRPPCSVMLVGGLKQKQQLPLEVNLGLDTHTGHARFERVPGQASTKVRMSLVCRPS